MTTPLIIFWSLTLFLLKPNNLALLKLIFTITLVISGYLAIAYTYLLTNRLECIATPSYNIIILIKYLNCM